MRKSNTGGQLLNIIAHDLGYTELISAVRSFPDDDITAILVDVAHTPAISETEYADVSGDECTDTDYSQRLLTGKSVSFSEDVNKFLADKINFTADASGGTGSVSGKYIYLIFGTAGSLNATDRILGHIDLTASGNATTNNGEFSFTPHEDGIFYVEKPVLVV